MQLAYGCDIARRQTRSSGTGSDKVEELIWPDWTNSICGVRGSASSEFHKIVGGTKAYPYEFPWQASIRNKHDSVVCGAIVIDRNWVVSAGHCLIGTPPSKITVMAGDYNITKDEGKEQRRKVESIYIHPNYQPATENNDIGLMKLTEPLIFDGKTVMPICLPPSPAYFAGGYPMNECVVSGWGCTQEAGPKSDVLLKITVPLVPDQNCRTNYQKAEREVYDQMVCAGIKEGGKDACQADSGGPLACPSSNNRYFLAGVVSWGKGCGRAEYPGVYTEVTYFVEWIKSVMEAHGTGSATAQATK